MRFSKFAQFLEEASQISGPGSRHRRILRILPLGARLGTFSCHEGYWHCESKSKIVRTLFEAVRSTEEMKLVLKLMLCDLDKINATFQATE